MKLRLPHISPGRTLRIAAILTLVSLALMVWSLLDPTVLPVMIAMSIGQMIGTLAFIAYGWIVFKDVTRQKRARRMSMQELDPPNKVFPPDSLQMEKIR